jgi:type I restriction enzyme, S subunit
MSVPRYARYRDSGVPWLGEVPEHWSVGAIKHFVMPKAGAIKTGPFGSHLTSADMQTGEVKVYNQRSVIDGDFFAGENFISQEKFSQLQSFETFPGDLLVTTRGTIGRAAILPANAERGILHPCLLRIQPDNSRISTRFLKELIQESTLVRTQLSYLSNATTIDVIYSETMASVVVPVPPVSEQDLILQFLSVETTKLDALMEEQRRLIELLKEKRQAVISQAVTKGVYPDAPMKDSGIAWLGPVPEHWRVGSLKRFWRVTDCKHVTAEFVEEGIPLASIREVQAWWVTLDKAKRTTEFFYDQLIDGDRKPLPGDLIFSRNATVGEVAQVSETHGAFAMGQDVCLLRKSDQAYSTDYLQYVIRSSVVVEQLQNLMVGSTFKRVNVEEIKALIIPMPPPCEQSAIADHLATESSQIDVLISEADRVIDLLQERRTALISAAVTGKIDVRGLVEVSVA